MPQKNWTNSYGGVITGGLYWQAHHNQSCNLTDLCLTVKQDTGFVGESTGMVWALLAQSHKVWPSLKPLGIDLRPHGGRRRKEEGRRKKEKLYLAFTWSFTVSLQAGGPATSQKLPHSLHQYVLNGKTSLTHKSPFQGRSLRNYIPVVHKTDSFSLLKIKFSPLDPYFFKATTSNV